MSHIQVCVCIKALYCVYYKLRLFVDFRQSRIDDRRLEAKQLNAIFEEFYHGLLIPWVEVVQLMDLDPPQDIYKVGLFEFISILDDKSDAIKELALLFMHMGLFRSLVT